MWSFSAAAFKLFEKSEKRKLPLEMDSGKFKSACESMENGGRRENRKGQMLTSEKAKYLHVFGKHQMFEFEAGSSHIRFEWIALRWYALS